MYQFGHGMAAKLGKIFQGADQGINKRSEFGHRTGTKDFRTGFYKGTDRAKAGTIMQDRPTRPIKSLP